MTSTSPARRSVRVAAHAYPWDVLGDPAFPQRVADANVAEVTLAATYHGTRAATPHHPAHRVVNASAAALYRPVRPEAWQLASLTPVSAPWVSAQDPFAESADALASAGLRVNAWVVLAHSTRLGTLRPDLAVNNCFDDRYPYALCPSHPEVRDYCATLASEALRGVAVDGVSIEGCGQMGLAHNGTHEKTDGAYGPTAQRLLSVCCCRGCQAAWSAEGLDPEDLRLSLRAAVVSSQEGSAEGRTVEELLGAELTEALLACRLSSQAAMRERVLAEVHTVAPQARVTLHGQPDRWATGPSPAVTAQAAGAVDSVLVPAWVPGSSTLGAITEMRRVAPGATSVGAYVTVLPPATLGAVQEHVDALLGAGADELHLYHLGLANAAQLAELRRIAAAVA